jgi:uncharacterized membrane protein YuzA (DUF378 family)
MNNLNVFDWLTVAVLVVGGVNWGMIGAFNIDLVSYLFGEMTTLTRVIYSLVGISAVYVILAALYASTEETASRVVHP